jgi:8-oxo-dGTP pyrophosphatase MutT (NUDIX family)
MSRRMRTELSAGGVVVRSDDGESFVLLIRDRYDNWGFPKGHVEDGEALDHAALREVAEETGATGLAVRGGIGSIDWQFRVAGRVIRKTCHFFLMETAVAHTSPQRAEGITACRWARFDEAESLLSYANARDVLRRAHEMFQSAASA